jgi:hypothetical protein
MAAFNKYDCFVGDLGLKLHNLNTDTLKVMLSNHQPVVEDTVYTVGDDVATGGGYTRSDASYDIANTYSQTAGLGTLAGTDVTFYATTGFGPFQFVVLYNDTAAAKNLIGWWDYASSVTLAALETFKVDFSTSVLTLQ